MSFDYLFLILISTVLGLMSNLFQQKLLLYLNRDRCVPIDISVCFFIFFPASLSTWGCFWNPFTCKYFRYFFGLIWSLWLGDKSILVLLHDLFLAFSYFLKGFWIVSFKVANCCFSFWCGNYNELKGIVLFLVIPSCR